jgi:hypothetical protein
MVAAPFGADWGSVIEPGTVWPGILLSRLANETLAFNILVLITFPLSAAALYHLALGLTKSRPAALLGGCAWAFGPAHLWKSWAWIPLANLQWLPLILLALLEFRRTRRTAWALAGGLLFALNALTSYVYGLVAAVMLLLFGGYDLLTRHLAGEGLRIPAGTAARALAGGGLAAALLLPWALPILGRMGGGDLYKAVWPMEDLYALTAAPSDYLFPHQGSPLRPLFTGIDPPDPLRGDFTHGLSPGAALLLLLPAAAWSLRRGRNRDPLGPGGRFPLLFLWFLLGVGLLLSTVPPTVTLRLPLVGPLEIRGPGYFGYGLAPWFREYARFGVLAVMAAVLLGSWGLAWVLRRAGGRARWRRALPGGILLLLLAEYGLGYPPGAAPLDTGTVPEVYGWLAAEPNDRAVAEYPVERPGQVNSVYLHYATVHAKPLVNGNGFSFRSDLLMPAVWDLTDRQTRGVLAALGVRLVLVHNSFPAFPQWYGGVAVPASVTADFPPVRSFGTATVLEVTGEPARVAACPGEGMELVPDAAAVPWWRLRDTARLHLVDLAGGGQRVVLGFTLGGAGERVGLSLEDGTPLPTRVVPGRHPLLLAGPLTVPDSGLRRQRIPATLPLRLTTPPGETAHLRDFLLLPEGGTPPGTAPPDPVPPSGGGGARSPTAGSAGGSGRGTRGAR